jgi:hypothetical protein
MYPLCDDGRHHKEGIKLPSLHFVLKLVNTNSLLAWTAQLFEYNSLRADGCKPKEYIQLFHSFFGMTGVIAESKCLSNSLFVMTGVIAKRAIKGLGREELAVMVWVWTRNEHTFVFDTL